MTFYDHDQNIQNCGRGLRKLGQRFPALFIEDQLRVHVRGLGPKFPSRSTVRTESERSPNGVYRPCNTGIDALDIFNLTEQHVHDMYPMNMLIGR